MNTPLIFASNKRIGINTTAPKSFITIFDTVDRKEIGRFYVENNEFKFEGNAHESAKVFVRELKDQFDIYLKSITK